MLRPWKRSVPSTATTTGDPADRRLLEGVVLDLDGHDVPLRAVFQQGPVVLVWLRHYG
jgi:hypothetical protein